MTVPPPDDRIIPDCCSTEDQRIGTNPDIIADDNWRGLEPHCSHTAFCTVIMVLIVDQNIGTQHHIVADFNMIVGSNNAPIAHSKILSNFQFSTFANSDLCTIMHFQLFRNAQLGFSIYGDFGHRRHNFRKGCMKPSTILNLQNSILNSPKRNTKQRLNVFYSSFPSNA